MTERIIAIGDVHGCTKSLETLIEAIQPTELDTLVFLGDYIDRGPDSKGVIDQIIALGDRCTVISLMGNHEEMLLAVLDGGQSEVKFWLTFGGVAALASYGWKGGPDVRPADVRSLIPREHVDLIKSCRDCFETVRSTEVGRTSMGIPPARPRAALLGQGRHRRAHAAEKRRHPRPRILQVHRHACPRWRVVDRTGGRTWAAGVAGE